MIRTLVLSLTTVALVAIASSLTITSSSVCFNDLDCPADSFCTGFRDRTQTGRCARSAPCTFPGPGECAEGFTCRADNSRAQQLFCRRRSSLGEACKPRDIRPCFGSLRCNATTDTCQPLTTGFGGSPCRRQDQCQQDQGFFCQFRSRMCAPKRGPGAMCMFSECLGFCARSGLENGTCLPARKEGQVCTSVEQCENRFDRDPRPDNLVCNPPDGISNTVGRCVQESRLLRRAGTECDPEQDRCDARRSLSCHSTDDGRHVCHHRDSRFGSRFGNQLENYCDPQSRFSRCPGAETKQECRLERSVTGTEQRSIPNPFFQCLRRSEVVPRGGVCVTEFAVCEKGAECREVPGVLADLFELPRFRPPKAAFCLSLIQEGKTCGDVTDKFTTQCREGLRCDNGTCVKAMNSEAPFDESLTHAGLMTVCDDLPCVPGLVCRRENRGARRCMLPRRIVRKGMKCIDRAVEQLRCVDGLVCAHRKDGTAVKRCREPREAGDYCQENSECEQGLLCAMRWTKNREQVERRCYDPNTALRLGQSCDPEASGSQPQCVVHENPGSFVRDEIEAMRCVAKGDGFACRIIVGLFERCGEEKDIACDSGLNCGRFNVCIPVSEM